MNTQYRKATLVQAERVCYIVQHTKAVIYPDYYTKAVVDFFGRLHSIDNIVKDIEAYHDPRNPHSGDVMKKCGLLYEGTARQAGKNMQGICDNVHYAILKEDYFAE